LKTKVNILFWLLQFVAIFVIGQMPDSLATQGKITETIDSIPSFIPTISDDGTLGAPTSSNVMDTFKLDVSSIDISENGVDEEIQYNAQDSMFFDIENKKILLWGDAVVIYQTMTIKAAHIVIDWEANTMYAEGREEFGQIIGKPHFTEKSSDFDASRMTYNFKSQKGIIHQAITKQEGMNVVGQKTKFIGGGEDTTQTDVIYSRNAIFTTCDLDHPHFGIRSRKQKVIPDKVVVIGPSNLEIAGVPTPLVLPFGFFPLKQGRRTGLIFPQNYEYSQEDGYGLEGIGWFFPINDYMNLTVTGNIYFRGTFGISARSAYLQRYRYRGDLNLGYTRQRSELEGRSIFNPAYSFRWSHNQDSKAHPYQTFGGNINIQTNNFQSRTGDDFQSISQSTLSSNLSYSYNFQGPFKLSTSFRHSQNTNTRRVTINFPDVNFQTQTLFPFKRKDTSSSQEKWYEKISFRYVGEMRNTFIATDTTLFSQATLDDARYGVRHTVTPSMSFTVAKYFNVTPSINYSENWYFQVINKTFDPTVEVTLDTIFNQNDSTEFTVEADTTQFGTVNTELLNSFRPYRQFNAGINVNTQLFGTILFKRGFLRGLRHVMKPSVGLNFTPDYTDRRWEYFNSVRTDIRNEEEELYTIFEEGIYDRPDDSGRRMALNYSIQNIFEAKIRSKKDSTTRNIKLLRNFRVSGDYNFAADSLKWSQVRMTGQTTFFNSITNANFSLVYDPYDIDSTSRRRINQFYFNNTGRVLRFVQANLRLSSRITVKKIRDFFKGKDTESDPDTRIAPNSFQGQFGRSDLPSNSQIGRGAPPQQGEENTALPPSKSLIDLFESFSINHNFVITRNFINGVDSTRVSTHTIDTRGQIAISNNWNVNVGNIGYDFLNRRVTYPSLGFSRDLHCWELGVQWTPQRDSYGFYIRVKPGRLDFINIPYNSGNAGRGFGNGF